VLIGSDVVGGPLPVAFEGVIVNVYIVSGDKPININKTSLVVWVVVAGEDSME